MPAALMAVNSELSPRFPKAISDESKMANGSACGTNDNPMYQKNKLTDKERSDKEKSELLGNEYV
jgi:hypothetical protein